MTNWSIILTQQGAHSIKISSYQLKANNCKLMRSSKCWHRISKVDPRSNICLSSMKIPTMKVPHDRICTRSRGIYQRKRTTQITNQLTELLLKLTRIKNKLNCLWGPPMIMLVAGAQQLNLNDWSTLRTNWGTCVGIWTSGQSNRTTKMNDYLK